MKKKWIGTLILLPIGFMAMKTPSQKRIDKEQMERGQKVYENNCLGCHQADGNGVPSLNPPLVKTKWVLGDKKKLIGILLNGLQQEIRINDEVYTNPMPSQAHLTDQEIADVLTYVRNSFGNKASAVLVKEVGKEKAQRQ